MGSLNYPSVSIHLAISLNFDIEARKNFLHLIRERESLMCVAGVPEPHARTLPLEGLLVVRLFCETGMRLQSDSTREADLFAKEVFYYRVLDMFAQVYDKGVASMTRDKSITAPIDKLVSYNSATVSASLTSL
jgi:hypothetical protein